MKKRLFFDLDGTLIEYKPVISVEQFLQPGYFLYLRPFCQMLKTVQALMEDPDVEVYILTGIPKKSKTAKREKLTWIKWNLPGFPEDHCLFVINGEDKQESVPGGIRNSDCLIDDYSHNLHFWKGKGIKAMNGVNGHHGTWKADTINVYDDASLILQKIRSAANV
jgi:5'(3')-deoxyribonucleotidase